MSDPAGVTTYKYDRRGLLRQESRYPKPCKLAPLTCTSSREAFVSTYGHDANGNRTSIAYPSTNVVTYTFDYANRPFSATSGATPLVSSAAYQAFGPLRSLVFGNGTSQTFTHDERYQPLTQQVLSGATPIASYTYDHDPAGNITQIHDALDAAWNRDFGYDDLSRLTTATGGASLWGAGSYAYDAMGNLLTSVLGSTTTTFGYSTTTPKLTTVTQTSQPSVSVTYDSAGNELQSAATQTISPRNLVSSILNATTRIANAYDGRGVRAESKIHPPPPATNWNAMVRHVYSPDLRPLTRYEYDQHLSQPRLQKVTDTVWFADRPIAQIDGTGAPVITTTAADHLGTPFLQTNAAGTIVWRAEYDPYGTVHMMRTGTETAQPLRFPGQEVVGSVAERYNVFRWYRAGWGRYTQSDPLGPGGDAHPYGYASGNPVSFGDPLGLYTIVSATPTERQALENAFALIQKQMANNNCGDCRTYFAAQNNLQDIDVWTQPGGLPYISAVPKAANVSPDIHGYSQKGPPFAYTFLFKDRFPPEKKKLSPCDLASLILHEAGHLARQDTTDNEPSEFFKKCKFGCINPGKFK